MKEKENIGYDMVLGGFFGVIALVLPVLFHLIGAGAASIFLPMFLPIVVLACVVHWKVATSVAIIAPLLSTLLTGMPPFWPPITFVMVMELLTMSSIIVILYQKKKVNLYVTLIISALADRALLFLIYFSLEKIFLVVSGIFSGIVILKGIPGFILQLIVVPPLVKYLEPRVREIKQLE